MRFLASQLNSAARTCFLLRVRITPNMTFISEAEILALLHLTEEDMLWLIQGLISGTLWMIGEFADDDEDFYEDESVEDRLDNSWELLAY